MSKVQDKQPHTRVKQWKTVDSTHTSYKNLASTQSSRERTYEGVVSKYRRDGFGIAVCTVEPRIGVLPAVLAGHGIGQARTQAKPAPAFAMTLSSRWSPSVASPNLSILACTDTVPSTKNSNDWLRWTFPSTHTSISPKCIGATTRLPHGSRPAINCDTATNNCRATLVSLSQHPILAPLPRGRTPIAASEPTYTNSLRLSRPQMA